MKSTSAKKQKPQPSELSSTQKYITERLEESTNRRKIQKYAKHATTHNENSLSINCHSTPKHLINIPYADNHLCQDHRPLVKGVLDNCLRQYRYCTAPTASDLPVSEWEIKVQQIIEEKLQNLLQSTIERTVRQYLDAQKETYVRMLQQTQQEILSKTAVIHRNYDYILQTYDSFLKIVQSLKNRSTKTDSSKTKQLEQTLFQHTQEIAKLQQKITAISKQVQEINPSPNLCDTKIEPILLNYEQDPEFNRESLRIVVGTYNENFRQINQKLRELYCHLA